jgi:hypothetical protein
MCMVLALAMGGYIGVRRLDRTVIPNQESPSGTMCGAYQWSLISSCQGHNPVVSCPSGYHFGVAVSSGSDQLKTCFKD